MGWAPRTLNVALPDKLSELSGGVKIVTCRYLGGGQIERIETAKAVRGMERLASAGSSFLEAVRDKKMEATTAPKVISETTTLDKLLIEYPPDLVCARVVRSLDDGIADVQAWVDDSHPDVLKHVAVQVLRESGLIPETETDQGKDFGGSSAS